MSKNKNAIEVKNLQKSFGKNAVLKDISFSVPRGTMLALLGPNGAGKTTTVRILSTLQKADGGSVTIEGFDVEKQSKDVKGVIGLTGQSAAVDELLTGRENLVMMGRLYRLTKKSATARALELLEDFDLVDAADRKTSTYSGGMRRRLDLAVSLIAVPPIIFLDEPTTGLDPRSRLVMWNIIKNLMEQGTTILLTTQYLEEADQLADKIILINDGRVAAEGTAKELKDRIGNDRLLVAFKSQEHAAKAMKLLEKYDPIKDEENLQVSLAIKSNGSDVRSILGILEKATITIASMDIHKPTLDDVFLSLTEKGVR
jgi:ABC-2 type transport system ATP-binding protein